MRAASKRGAGMSLGQGEEVPAMKNVLVLVRHGESEWNRLNMFTGWHNPDLSEKGLIEALVAARLLKAAGLHFAHDRDPHARYARHRERLPDLDQPRVRRGGGPVPGGVR